MLQTYNDFVKNESDFTCGLVYFDIIFVDDQALVVARYLRQRRTSSTGSIKVASCLPADSAEINTNMKWVPVKQ